MGLTEHKTTEHSRLAKHKAELSRLGKSRVEWHRVRQGRQGKVEKSSRVHR